MSKLCVHTISLLLNIYLDLCEKPVLTTRDLRLLKGGVVLMLGKSDSNYLSYMENIFAFKRHKICSFPPWPLFGEEGDKCVDQTQPVCIAGRLVPSLITKAEEGRGRGATFFQTGT